MLSVYWKPDFCMKENLNVFGKEVVAMKDDCRKVPDWIECKNNLQRERRVLPTNPLVALIEKHESKGEIIWGKLLGRLEGKVLKKARDKLDGKTVILLLFSIFSLQYDILRYSDHFFANCNMKKYVYCFICTIQCTFLKSVTANFRPVICKLGLLSVTIWQIVKG